ncbi:uncharacterized protein LOC116205844 isoform X2 [Punica granatum]|uniref:Uncharacterized protein LOC116205844 isoform X2 n=1 Tax=Punica granatum TaxID=22663 RepID=A0A6P8DCT1_PUNGR|nr:uncharacterized protein LOC116205844 isoform X2 [Punica granatum]
MDSLKVQFISSTDSPEFAHLTRALTQYSIIGLDAEWKPTRSSQLSIFPTVSLLQLACRLSHGLEGSAESDDSPVFLLDLSSIPLPSIWEILRDVFTSPDILKLGFQFKQDLKYLSSTFCAQGCDPGFDRVEPYMDIMSIYSFLQQKRVGRKLHKDTKSLATICEEILGFSLSKELQCSDWSQCPLTEEQKAYAARDAHCLLQIFHVFKTRVAGEGQCLNGDTTVYSHISRGLKELLQVPDKDSTILTNKFVEALRIVQAASTSEYPHRVAVVNGAVPRSSCTNTRPMDESLLRIVRKYGDKILLNESDRKPKPFGKKGKKRSSVVTISKEKRETSDEWEGPPPWDLAVGGDGCPKFLCDVMVEGLAKHLRCVGIDAAIPYLKKPEPRDLIGQAQRENRVLLTRDAKLLRHEYLLKNQIYRIKSLLKNEQLIEVIETFQLQICEDQLMSRCTKCNGRFIQKPLTMEEAVEAAKGFQKIPNCLFDKNLEFWQCMDCNQLYWEGTQYHNAVQKFIDVCKLNDDVLYSNGYSLESLFWLKELLSISSKHRIKF